MDEGLIKGLIRLSSLSHSKSATIAPFDSERDASKRENQRGSKQGEWAEQMQHAGN